MCVAPIKVTHGELVAMVRCGQCVKCRIRRKQAWVGRLRLEALDHEHSRFLTLTYRREERPEVLPLDHLRDFMKRYRYHYGVCRFFAVGEYGEDFGGAHWHVIIFGHPPIPEAVLAGKKGAHWYDNKAWRFGFTQDGTVTPASIGYCAGYTVKGLSKGERVPICRQSLKPGIGFRRIGAMGETAARTPLKMWPTSYTVGGRHYPLSDGAMARFQVSYLEAGGVPPAMQTPEALDFSARVTLGDLGTRLRSQEARNLKFWRDKDGQAAKAFSTRK